MKERIERDDDIAKQMASTGKKAKARRAQARCTASRQITGFVATAVS
jgi:hypothetical protein